LGGVGRPKGRHNDFTNRLDEGLVDVKNRPTLKKAKSYYSYSSGQAGRQYGRMPRLFRMKRPDGSQFKVSHDLKAPFGRLKLELAT
jgi:uncharacterized protein affecting Mg2+/Co2+ transport